MKIIRACHLRSADSPQSRMGMEKISYVDHERSRWNIPFVDVVTNPSLSVWVNTDEASVSHNGEIAFTFGDHRISIELNPKDHSLNARINNRSFLEKSVRIEQSRFHLQVYVENTHKTRLMCLANGVTIIDRSIFVCGMTGNSVDSIQLCAPNVSGKTQLYYNHVVIGRDGLLGDLRVIPPWDARAHQDKEFGFGDINGGGYD